MEYLVITLLIIIMLLLLGFTSLQGKKYKEKVKKDAVFKNFCPLCGSGLKKGEKVHSKVYPVSKKSDGRYSGGIEKMMEVYGCPNCAPPGGRQIRICPACKKSLPENGYVIGRYFIKPDKNHLHVLGCTRCKRV